MRSITANILEESIKSIVEKFNKKNISGYNADEEKTWKACQKENNYEEKNNNKEKARKTYQAKNNKKKVDWRYENEPFTVEDYETQECEESYLNKEIYNHSGYIELAKKCLEKARSVVDETENMVVLSKPKKSHCVVCVNHMKFYVLVGESVEDFGRKIENRLDGVD